MAQLFSVLYNCAPWGPLAFPFPPPVNEQTRSVSRRYWPVNFAGRRLSVCCGRRAAHHFYSQWRIIDD